MIDTRLIAPRDIIGKTLLQIADEDKTLLVLDCDLGRSTRLSSFEQKFPSRFI